MPAHDTIIIFLQEINPFTTEMTHERRTRSLCIQMSGQSFMNAKLVTPEVLVVLFFPDFKFCNITQSKTILQLHLDVASASYATQRPCVVTRLSVIEVLDLPPHCLSFCVPGNCGGTRLADTTCHRKELTTASRVLDYPSLPTEREGDALAPRLTGRVGIKAQFQHNT